MPGCDGSLGPVRDRIGGVLCAAVVGYLIQLASGVLLEVLATRTRARTPPLEHVLARVTRTRTGRVGVLVAWAWVGLRFFAR